LGVGWIADILPYGSIGLIPPSRLFVEDQFIEGNEIFCDILSHLLSPAPTQVLTAGPREIRRSSF
jgi:hypothetical protein